MSNSSEVQTYTITLDNDIDTTQTIDITVPSETIWDLGAIPALTTSDIITLTNTNSNHSYADTISSIDITGFDDWFKEEFDGRFPDYDRVQSMCKDYPGLEIAYRKFKEVYKMVKEDYDGKERERDRNL
jgi:hypothetical protein